MAKKKSKPKFVIEVCLKRGVWVEVNSYTAASKVVREYIDENNLGSKEFSGGSIKHNGKVIAHVSYNGRVWAGAKYDPKAKFYLYDPRVSE